MNLDEYDLEDSFIVPDDGLDADDEEYDYKVNYFLTISTLEKLEEGDSSSSEVERTRELSDYKRRKIESDTNHSKKISSDGPSRARRHSTTSIYPTRLQTSSPFIISPGNLHPHHY